MAEGYAGAVWIAARTRLVAQRLVRRFVIFAQGRTGSTLLTSSLDSHPEIRCADEILGRPRGDPKAYVENRARLCRTARKLRRHDTVRLVGKRARETAPWYCRDLQR